MSARHAQLFDRLCQYVRETALLVATESCLAWDERTLLPPEAGAFRAEQVAFLAGMIHARWTDKRLADWLVELAASPLAADPHSDAGTTIRQLKRSVDKKVKLPQALVEELTRVTSLAQHAWQEARENDDYNSLEPHVQRVYELKREQAQALGGGAELYDPLLDDFEPGESTANVRRVLADLRDALVPLVAAIAGSPRRPDTSVLRHHYPTERQEWFARDVVGRLGFDFRRGRLDVTAHPFCSSVGPHDCRLTTRYDEHYFPTAFFGTLHEAGHGMYDQGLRPEHFGFPPGEAVSLGIHESQSRMWENLVGRSRAFWQHFFPAAQQAFPEALAHARLDEFYFAVNDVRPSLIRVEADEATYNLHILLRFELEQDLLGGHLATGDLPAAWNEKYQQYLGIIPHNFANGVLQDIHWSAGLVGYFPTYSLGNLYAAQLFAAADRDLGGLAGQFATGQFAPLHDWLRERIHRPGQCYSAAELVQRVTGQPLSHAPLIAHLREKFGPLYGL